MRRALLLAAFACLAASARAGEPSLSMSQARTMASTGALDRGYDNSALRERVRADVAGKDGTGLRLPSTAAGEARAAVNVPAPSQPKESFFSGMFGKVKGFFTMKNMITYGAAAAGALAGGLIWGGLWPVLIGAAVGLAAGWALAKLFA